jgi:hypothetical protein
VIKAAFQTNAIPMPSGPKRVSIVFTADWPPRPSALTSRTLRPA